MLDNSCLDECTGCGACSAACPVKAISLRETVFGDGLVPVIDADACVSCGKCIHVHHSLQSTLNKSLGIAYGAKTNDEQLRVQSSSGGIFSELAQIVLNDNGLVVGAAFDSNLTLRHIAVSSVDDLAALRGSKYLQSRIDNDVLHSVRVALREKRSVLFVGTPCQVAGLRAYLRDECQDNLITVDLICHGSPSQSVFNSYIDDMEKRYNGHAVNCQFRNKDSRYRWADFQMDVQFDNGTKVISSFRDKDAYGQSFVENLFLRPSCSKCRYKGSYRASDITLGDFWGLENSQRDQYDISGVSLVIANTELGEKLVSSLKDSIYCFDSTFDVAMNSGGYAAVSRVNNKRHDAIKDLENGVPFGDVVAKYPVENKVKSTARRFIRKLRDVQHLMLSKRNGF